MNKQQTQLQPNPIGTGGWIVIGAAIIGGILLLTKKSKAEEKPALGPPPVEPGTPAPPPATNTSNLPPATQSTAWLKWDGCFRKGKTYRICSTMAQEPGAQAIKVAQDALDKLGLKVATFNYDKESSQACFIVSWVLADECGLPALPPETKIQVQP